MSISELDKIDERLRQIDDALLSKSKQNDNNSNENDELSSIDTRLAEIDSQLGKPNNGYSDFSPFLEARGVAKTLDSAIDVGRKTFPTTDYVVNSTNKMLGIDGYSTEPRDKKRLVNYVDELSGNSGDPVGKIGQFRQKLGEFLPGPTSGMKVAPAIAAVSTGLRSLGINEDYSDLISAIGVPNFKAITQLSTNALKKLTDYVATIGSEEFRRGGNVEKAAKFLQGKVGESNIPEVIKNIEEYQTPFKGNISEGEAAYRAPTADIADNVGLSQYNRAKAENIPEMGHLRKSNEEVMQREVNKLASETASSQAPQEFAAAERKNYQGGVEFNNIEARKKADIAAREFNKTARSEDAGRGTQDYLDSHVETIKKDAQAKASPLYKEAENVALEGKPANAFSTIEQEMKNSLSSSSTHADMKKSKIAIEDAAKDADMAKRSLIIEAKKKFKNDPKMLEITLKEIGNSPRGTYTAGNLDKSRKLMNEMMQAIPLNEKERRNALGRVISALDKDLESIPKIAEARSVYREGMKPANFIEEHPVLGKLINQDNGFTKQFTVTPAEIPARVTKGSKSVEGAKALMSEAAGLGKKEHTKMINELKSYVNSDILSNFVENSGKINPAKFEAWKEANPGSFILDPQLNTKLKNLENAQIHVDRTIKQNEELLSNFYKKSMDRFLGPKFEGIDSNKIAERILGSTNSEVVMEEAVQLMSKDKTGSAMEGLKRLIVDNLNSKFKSDKFTFATMNSYLDKNRKALTKVFNPDQIEVLEKVKDSLKKQAIMERSGKGTNSDSIPKLMENLAEKSGGKASKALLGAGSSSLVGGVIDYAKSIGEAGKLKYIHKALIDPKMAKFLLTKDIKTNKNFFDSLNNKEDFGKWLRQSKSWGDTFKDSVDGIKNNFSITSQAVGKAIINHDSY